MDTITKARRELDLLRGFIRRTGTTGWVDRTAKHNYSTALRAVAAVEEERGVEDPTSIKLSDRLTALRDEARRAGLLSYSDETEADRLAFRGGA